MSEPRILIRSVEFDAYVLEVHRHDSYREYAVSSDEHLMGFLPQLLTTLKIESGLWNKAQDEKRQAELKDPGRTSAVLDRDLWR